MHTLNTEITNRKGNSAVHNESEEKKIKWKRSALLSAVGTALSAVIVVAAALACNGSQGRTLAAVGVNAVVSDVSEKVSSVTGSDLPHTDEPSVTDRDAVTRADDTTDPDDIPEIGYDDVVVPPFMYGNYMIEQGGGIWNYKPEPTVAETETTVPKTTTEPVTTTRPVTTKPVTTKPVTTKPPVTTTEPPSPEPPDVSEVSDKALAVVEIAKSQVGVKEKPHNNVKYNTWFYGREVRDPNSKSTAHAWCVVFISWCADRAGVPTTVVPKTAGVWYIMGFYRELGLYHARRDGYIPNPGDVIIFGNADHAGLVASCDGVNVTVIEGNYSDRVMMNTYSLKSTKILGYCSPDYN